MVNCCLLLLGVLVLEACADPGTPSNSSALEVGPIEEPPLSYPETLVVLLPANETSGSQSRLVLLALADPRAAPNDTDPALNTVEGPDERDDMILIVAAEQSPEGNYTGVIKNINSTKHWDPLKFKVKQEYIRKRRSLEGAPLVRKKRTHMKHCKKCGMVMPILIGLMKKHGGGGGGCGHGGCGQSYAPPPPVYSPCGQPACGGPPPMYHPKPKPMYHPQPVYYQPQPTYHQPQPTYHQPQQCNRCQTGGSPHSGSWSTSSSSSSSQSSSGSWGRK